MKQTVKEDPPPQAKPANQLTARGSSRHPVRKKRSAGEKLKLPQVLDERDQTSTEFTLSKN